MDTDNLYETDTFVDDWMEYTLYYYEDVAWQRHYDQLAETYAGINEYYRGLQLARLDYIEEYGRSAPF